MFVERFRRCLRRGDDEQGSMVIALLAVIVTSGLMISITATTLGGHRAVRFDRDHIRVVQGADAGLEEALYRLGSTDPAVRINPPVAMTPAPGIALPDGSRYRYEVVAVLGSSTSWQINSIATMGSPPVTRRVFAVVSRPQPFRHAAFADANLVLRGANSADSYSATQWPTDKGVVGSNGTITLNGSVSANGAELHNYEAAPDPARCTSNGNTVCTGAAQIPAKLDVSSEEATGFINDAVTTPSPAPGACGTTTAAFTGTSLEARPEPYCFTTMNLSADFTVTGAGSAIVYLTNDSPDTTTFGVSNKVKVNCASCSGTGTTPPPEAGRLQIFTKSVGPIRIGNHAHVAATIYAPNAACGGNYSNAGANFYGSMVCKIISNQGAWSFHYDDRLTNLGVGGWAVRRWSEG